MVVESDSKTEFPVVENFEKSQNRVSCSGFFISFLFEIFAFTFVCFLVLYFLLFKVCGASTRSYFGPLVKHFLRVYECLLPNFSLDIRGIMISANSCVSFFLKLLFLTILLRDWSNLWGILS